MYLEQSPPGSAPSPQWQKTTQALLEGIGSEPFKQFVLRWVPLFDKPRTVLVEHNGQRVRDPNELPHYVNANILRGMACKYGAREDAEIASLVYTQQGRRYHLRHRCWHALA